MSLTGGISFFDRNKALFEDGSVASASSGNDGANLMLGTNKFFQWISIGSDDTTTETITITLASAQDITRIFIADHNWKQYTIKFGSTPSDFTNVVGLDGPLGGGISETVYAEDTAYYQFDSVNTDTIEITVTKTQVADEEKRLVLFIVTEELGTLVGFPRNNGVNLDRNVKKVKAISGRMHVTKSYESASMSLSLKTYPLQDDIDLLDSLHDRNIPFLVWANGGVDSQFRLKQRGWRLKDIYQMQTDKGTRNAYDKNVYIMGVNQSYSFTEVV